MFREDHFARVRKMVFFDQESGMEIRITAKGIRETLGNGNRFQTLPKKLKIKKVATKFKVDILLMTKWSIRIRKMAINMHISEIA